MEKELITAKEFEPRVNLTEYTYKKILQSIIAGNYKPGTRLPSENELKETFNVSRNTVRTALNKLNVLGILETRQGDGSYIKKLSIDMYLNTFVPAILIHEDSLMELIQLRKAIEIASASMAAERATQEDINIMQALLDSSRAAGDDMQAYAESTVNFHYHVALASKNPIFATMMELIKYVLTSKMVNFLTYTRNDRNSTFYHTMILESIKNRRPDEAAYLMERHMIHLVDRVNEYNEHTKLFPEHG
jgi:Transcriptional regulators